MRKRVWSLTNMVIEFLVGIGTIVFVTRAYPTQSAGAWFLFIAVFAIASSLRDALIQPALVKDTAGKNGKALLSILKSNLQITLFFELTLSTLIVITGYFLGGEVGDLLLWLPLYSFANAWQRWQIFYLRSRLELDKILKSGFISSITLAIGMALIFFFQLPIHFLVAALGISNLAGGLYLSRHSQTSQIINSKTDTHHFRAVVRYGFYAMGREATSSVSSRISLFITSSYLTLQHTAILGISQRFAQVALLPSNSFQSILFPGLIQAVQNGEHDKARKLFHDSLSLLLALTIPASILGIAASPYLLAWLNGAQYASSWGYLAVYVLIATFITPFGAAFGSVVTAWGKPQLAFRLVLLNSILNITLSFFLIRSIGIAGAPLAMVIVELFGIVCVAYFLKDVGGIAIRDSISQIPNWYVQGFKKLISFAPSSLPLRTAKNKL